MVNAKGLRFIPADTPAFQDITVGEWAYRGCPNPSTWKYGLGKHFLLGSSYVFPNGDMTPVGGKCIKNVTGYDFTRFLTGAYSDLAIGVQYIIKLMPLPAFRYRYDLSFQSLGALAQFIGELQNCPVSPAYLFWADEKAGRKLFGNQQSGHRVLMELDGNEIEVRDIVKSINKILNRVKIEGDAVVLPNMSYLEDREDGLWIMDEFKIHYSVIDKFEQYFKKTLKQFGIEGGLFGYPADGKVHLYFEKRHPETKKILTALEEGSKELGGIRTGKFVRLYDGIAEGPLGALENSFRKVKDPQLIFNQIGK